MPKTIALITGISGQDGSYLAEFLLEQGYDVCGIIRRNSSVNYKSLSRIKHIFDHIILEYGDLTDMSSIASIIKKHRPTEIYNLAAQSHVRISFDNPILTSTINCIGVLNVLESIRLIDPSIKMYQAASSENFGNQIDADGFQRETTPMEPVSPYGVSKLYSYNLVKNYRESYKMFLTNGILFNHESPRRGENFVSQKIVKAAVEIKMGYRNQLTLGNIHSQRDWGHAKDYVRAMHLIMQQEFPQDYVCATGITHSVEYMLKYVFDKVGLDWKNYVKYDKIYERPTEVDILKGDSSKLRALGWKPIYTFETMLDEMIDHWLSVLSNTVVW